MERIEFARHLRREMTVTERRLWNVLRGSTLGYRFRRQVPRGPYILDFACLERRLVIELDGAQHADSDKDPIRDAWLTAKGFRVLRFWNRDLLHNLDGVVRQISEALHAPLPPHQEPQPVLSPTGERGVTVFGCSRFISESMSLEPAPE